MKINPKGYEAKAAKGNILGSSSRVDDFFKPPAGGHAWDSDGCQDMFFLVSQS